MSHSPFHKPSVLSFACSDASVRPIAAAAYLKVTHGDGHSEVSFIMGKAKLAPVPELTISRLMLCAVVLAVELSELLTEEIDIKIDKTTFYTDSKVVLGYINNQHRRLGKKKICKKNVYRESSNLPNQTSGDMFLQSTTQLIMALGL